MMTTTTRMMKRTCRTSPCRTNQTSSRCATARTPAVPPCRAGVANAPRVVALGGAAAPSCPSAQLMIRARPVVSELRRASCAVASYFLPCARRPSASGSGHSQRPSPSRRTRRAPAREAFAAAARQPFQDLKPASYPDEGPRACLLGIRL